MRSVWPVPGTWVGASRRTDTEHHDSVCYDILEGGGGGRGAQPGMWIGVSSRTNTEHLSRSFRMLQQGT